METFSALLAICVGNSPVHGEFPTQRPVTRSCDVFFDLRLNKRLSKHSWGWWFETLSRPLWHQCNGNTQVPGSECWHRLLAYMCKRPRRYFCGKLVIPFIVDMEKLWNSKQIISCSGSNYGYNICACATTSSEKSTIEISTNMVTKWGVNVANHVTPIRYKSCEQMNTSRYTIKPHKHYTCISHLSTQSENWSLIVWINCLYMFNANYRRCLLLGSPEGNFTEFPEDIYMIYTSLKTTK